MVTAENSAGGKTQLVAYVVSNGAGVSSDLRNYLKQQFPEYMIPSRIVFLDALPLQPNGKLDRKALLGAQKGSADVNATLVAYPRNAEWEKEIARIWTELLEVEQVGIADNFFELGAAILYSPRRLFHGYYRNFQTQLPCKNSDQPPGLGMEMSEFNTHSQLNSSYDGQVQRQVEGSGSFKSDLLA